MDFSRLWSAGVMGMSCCCKTSPSVSPKAAADRERIKAAQSSSPIRLLPLIPAPLSLKRVVLRSQFSTAEHARHIVYTLRRAPDEASSCARGNDMRVIAGKFRGRPLRSLKGLDLRPTSDRLRETLFDVLTGGEPERLGGTVWLDLFAGTGAVGIEALSRGAANVYFVESSKKAAALIHANLKSLAIAGGFEVLSMTAAAALRRLESKNVACDFCFLDPPYRIEQAYAETLELLSGSPLLHGRSLVIAEHEKRFAPGDAVGALARYRILKQGDAALSFYRKTL